tara:strand:+ start:5457 stop:6245 length:789 start_codon:yes stop_codon:yes gene_type:complete
VLQLKKGDIMSKVEPLSFDLTTGRHDPKETVLPEIREQYPWHWDPMKQDHDDGKGLIGNWSNKLDWEGLSKWCIEKVNKMRLPNKWWDYNYETGFISHGGDDATHTPIREQALLMFKNNTFTTGNTQYFKIANQDFEHWEQPLRDMFPMLKQDKLGISLFVQIPGSMHWSHVDTYSSFIRRTGDTKANYTRLRRFMIFPRDWDFGHFFHYGNHCMNQWKAGDLWDLTPGVYHGSANSGPTPKITIHWSGELVDDWEGWDKWQ